MMSRCIQNRAMAMAMHVYCLVPRELWITQSHAMCFCMRESSNAPTGHASTHAVHVAQSFIFQPSGPSGASSCRCVEVSMKLNHVDLAVESETIAEEERVLTNRS